MNEEKKESDNHNFTKEYIHEVVSKLTYKQKLYCEEFMIDANRTQAATRAGYSANSADQIGSENMKKPDVLEYIKVLQSKRTKKIELKAEKVLEELINWAFGDFTELMELTIDDIKLLPKEIRRLIVGYKRTVRTFGKKQSNKEEVIEVKFVDKEKAMDMLNRHGGFYKEDNMQKVNDSPLVNVIYNDKTIDLSTD